MVQKSLIDEESDAIKLGTISKELEKEINAFAAEAPSEDIFMIKKLSKLKNKEIIREIIYEYEWKGNFVWIYPSRGGEVYEKFFQHQRQIQKYIHRCLFGEEII